MPPRTLGSLAHALAAAPDLDAGLVALGEGLAEVDRSACMALLRYDGRREMLVDRLTPAGGRVNCTPVETTFDHLPGPIRQAVSNGGQFVDLAEQSAEYARLFGLAPMPDGQLALRGVLFDGHLAAIVALYEPKKIFGTRAAERFAPAIALFELGFVRFSERDARDEAVRTLEDVTQRVHGEYVKKLAALERQLVQARGEASRAGRATPGAPDPAQIVALEREAARASEDARRRCGGPIGFAGALAYALLIRVGSHLSQHSAQQVVTVAAIGMIIGALPHLAVRRPARVSGMAIRLLCVACVAYIFRPLAGNSAVDRHWGLAFSLMTSLAVLALLLEAVLTALLRVDEQRARFRVALVDEMHVQLPLGAAVGASALLIAFAAEVMGLEALAVFTAPLLVTQVAFRRYAGIRATYLQTVRALAKVTEIGGYKESGNPRDPVPHAGDRGLEHAGVELPGQDPAEAGSAQ